MAAGPTLSTQATGPIVRAVAVDPLRPRGAGAIDWPRWTRSIDRKRRQFVVPRVWPGWVYRDGTRASFRLEGIDVSEADIAAAVMPAAVAAQMLRSRPQRRLRAHLAVLRRLDHARATRKILTADEVTGWYAALSAGLGTAGPVDAGGERLAATVRRINAPHRRLQPAVTDIARLHADLLVDPIFPGFNGLVARLLLHAHLTASGLPPVVFDAQHDAWREPAPTAIAGTLLVRIEQSLERLLVPSPGTAGRGLG